MTITITDIQQFPLDIQVQDKHGHPATLIAPPAWATSDPALLNVAVADDGLSATVLATGEIGQAQVTVTCEGGPEVGDDTFTGVLDVTIVGGKATQVVFASGAPTDQL